MRKSLTILIILTLATAFAGSAFASEEADAVSGTVVSYVSGKSITIQNDEGTLTYDIFEETEIKGNIRDGVSVIVEAEGKLAFYITVVETEG